MSRRGRPLGPRPFGRGLDAVEALLRDFEWDADREMRCDVKIHFRARALEERCQMVVGTLVLVPGKQECDRAYQKASKWTNDVLNTGAT